jgi:hypothetical protein
MKPLFIAFALLASVITTSSFAADPAVAPVVLKSFETQFVQAKEVAWSYTSGLYKAVFFLNNQQVVAYYDAEGTMVAVTRNITSLQLPLALQASLKNECADNQWIADLFEVTSENGVEYFATLETADAKVVLKASPASSWTTYQKAKKE